MIQLYYYFFVFLKLSAATSKEIDVPKKLPPVSVIICAKNEAENLSDHLPAFLQQDYKDYEIIVVNDCSTDHTEDVLMELKTRFNHLRYTSIPINKKFQHGKKLAVTVGIKAAKNEHLLFSDADCYPISDQWIKHMISNYSEQTEIVLGIGRYIRKKGILNTIVRYETLFTAMQYISFALKGKPFMGVGRNLSYKKDLFFKNKGFASHLKVLSGDDDLFINEVANKVNTGIALSQDSHTVSIPPANWPEWFKQKKRHLSTGKYYKPSARRMLGFEYSSRILFYSSFIFLLFHGPWNFPVLTIGILLIIVKGSIVKLVMNRLNEQDLLLSSLLLDIFMPIVLFILSLANIIRPREPKWS